MTPTSIAPPSLDVDALSESMKHFGTADYAVFVGMLALSSAVGLYFGYQDHKSKQANKKHGGGSDTANYLVGGRNMQVLPVALSLVASYVSGITLLGTPTEIYLYGSQYSFFLVGILLAAIVIHFIIIPVLHKLEITSTYQYLEERFNREVRLFGSVAFSIITILWLPLVIYMPALAFNQTTGVDVHVITPIAMFICIVYTSLGGIKAVVWTDVLQITLMYGTLTLIAVKGTLALGGLSVVIERNLDGQRFEQPNFSLDPTVRHSFWTLAIGGALFWLSINGANQVMVQRYLSLKSVRKARLSHAAFTFGAIVMISLCIYNGFLLFATYSDCDPLSTKLVKAKDQLLPLLAIDILRSYPGLTGVFVAGIFSAALSSVSTALNSMSAVFLMDFFGRRRLSKAQTTLVLRGTVVALGTLAVLLVYVVERLGAVLQLAMSVPSAMGGPLLGVFIVGLLLPWIGGRAAFWAAIGSSLAMTLVIMKAQVESLAGRIGFELKPVSVEGCNYNFTLADAPKHVEMVEDKQIYHVSYLYYTLMGSVLVVVFGAALSCCFGFQDARRVDRRLVAPFLRKFIQFEVVKSEKVTIEGEKVMRIYELKAVDEQ